MRRPPNKKLVLLAGALVLAAASASLYRTPAGAQAAAPARLAANHLGAL
jgi:hypothetical protein